MAVTVGQSQDVPLALTDARGEATVGLTSDQSLVYQAVASGSPVAGAWLWVQPSAASGGWTIGPGTWKATSASDGSFFIAGVASGHAYSLHAEANGYARRTLAIPAAPEGATRDTVRVILVRGQRVHGIIADTQGAPIPGTEVALQPVAETGDGGYSWDTTARKTSVTDARGAFEFPGTHAGRHELTANHPNHVSVLATAFDVPSGEGAEDVGTLTLEVGAAIEGVVRDFHRRPVGGAQVKVHQNNIDQRRPHDPEIRTAVTDKDGTFRIGELRADLADLVVEAEGYERFEMTAVRPRAGGLIEVQLGEGARLVGRVLDADGEGVANAYIWLSLERNPSIGRTAWSTDPRRHEARTDGDGRFHFDAVGAGPWSVEVGGEQLAEDVGAIRLRPGEEREIELRLRAQGRLAGVVTDTYGAPVAGAEVLVQTLDPTGQLTGTHHGARADAGGAYEVGRVPSGPARVVARHPDYRDGVAEVGIERGRNEVDLKLQPGWQISGTVSTAGGEPVPLARVEAHPVEQGSRPTPRPGCGRAPRRFHDRVAARVVGATGKRPEAAAVSAPGPGCQSRRAGSCLCDRNDARSKGQSPFFSLPRSGARRSRWTLWGRSRKPSEPSTNSIRSPGPTPRASSTRAGNVTWRFEVILTIMGAHRMRLAPRNRSSPRVAADVCEIYAGSCRSGHIPSSRFRPPRLRPRAAKATQGPSTVASPRNRSGGSRSA